MAPHALARIAGRPLVGAALLIAKPECGRLETKAVHALEEEAEPRIAPELSVGDRLQAGHLLRANRAANRIGQHCLVFGSADAPFTELPESFLQCRWPQQAADMVGMKKRGQSRVSSGNGQGADAVKKVDSDPTFVQDSQRLRRR